MGIFADLKVLYHLVCKPVRGANHAERMESFYGGQADAYDDFRKRLLQGREELFRQLQVGPGAVWVDMGGGTGSNLEYLADRIATFKHVYVVDLSRSLLDVAARRCRDRGWNNVTVCEADATTFQPPEKADVVTFSYSLTMIPDWFAAIDNGCAMLAENGQLGVVDFYVSRKYPRERARRHSWFTRNFWPVWFSSDNVFPCCDHLPYLERHVDVERVGEYFAKIPYLPLIRAPYYVFVGRRKTAFAAAKDSTN